MANLICRALSFAYDGADSQVFNDLDLLIDTGWRSALVGANGRGKTTLLKLLAGQLMPDRGEIECPLDCLLSSTEAAAGRTAFEAAKDVSGPFRSWERQIEALLERGDESSLARYGELENEYRARGGYEIDARLEAELEALGVPSHLACRPLEALSGGEQTRARLAGLFAAEGAFPLIDEPTNHLDRDGRQLLADYLAAKSGFLLVSHDRAFLDAAADHVIALNPDSVDVQRVDFSTWRSAHLARLAEQARTNALLKKDIARLQSAALARRSGAMDRESDKTAGGKRRLPSERGRDSGFIGARAARQMKRALAAERRADDAAEQRRQSLHDMEKAYAVSFAEPPAGLSAREPLLRVTDLRIGWSGWLFEPLTFTVRPGERLALTGPNGCGKSSLLGLLDAGTPSGQGQPGALRVQGECSLQARLISSQAFQIPRWQQGLLRDHLAGAGLAEARFRQLMAALGVRGSVLDQPVEQLSEGQLKKIELARSLSEPAHLYLWDEPLNYVDVDTRERLEAALLETDAAFIFVEHDARFVDHIATERLPLIPVPADQGD